MTKFQTLPVQKPILNSQMMAEKGWIQAFSTMNTIFDGDWGAKNLSNSGIDFKLSITPQFLKVFAEIPSFTMINSFDLGVSNANGILYLVNDVDIKPLKITNGVCLTSFTTSQTSFIDGILGRF